MAKNTTPDQDNFAPIHCSFCGKTQDQVRKLVRGPSNIFICDECVAACSEILEESLAQDFMAQGMPDLSELEQEFEVEDEGYETPVASSLIKRVPTPHEIYDELSAYVMGQEDAKRAMSVAVYNHYRRVLEGEAASESATDDAPLGKHAVDAADDVDTVELAKSNILLLGPTGTGKTLLAQTLARILEVPFAIADATALTEAGYVGEDVENILLKLITAADGDIERAQIGIIYVDEKSIRSLARPKTFPSRVTFRARACSRRFSRFLRAPLRAFRLRVAASIPSRSFCRLTPQTSCLSAVAPLWAWIRSISDRVGNKGVGFNSEIAGPSSTDENTLLHQVLPEDLNAFGMIPEFIGRTPVITQTCALSEDDLISILTEPEERHRQAVPSHVPLGGL